MISAIGAEAAETAAGANHCRLDNVINPGTSKVAGIKSIFVKSGREFTTYPNDARIREFPLSNRRR
jgi:hypothetical protein